MARYSRYRMLCLALVMACGHAPSVAGDTGPNVDAPATTVGMVSSPLDVESPNSPSETPDLDAPAHPVLPAAGPQGEVPPDLLEGVIVQAADELGLPVEQLQIVRAEAVDWPDGAWGCPEPGMVYTPALVRGYLVELQLGDMTLDYRADGAGRFRLCGIEGIAPPPLQPPVGGEHTEAPES